MQGILFIVGSMSSQGLRVKNSAQGMGKHSQLLPDLGGSIQTQACFSPSLCSATNHQRLKFSVPMDIDMRVETKQEFSTILSSSADNMATFTSAMYQPSSAGPGIYVCLPMMHALTFFPKRTES